MDRSEGLFIKSLRKLFYRVTRFVSDEHFFVDMAEFCLITSEVRDALIQDMSFFSIYSCGHWPGCGFAFKGVPYKRHPRVAGHSNFNVNRMITFAVAGILSTSTLPLRMMVYFFPIVILSATMALLGALGVLGSVGRLPLESNPLWQGCLFAILFYMAIGVMFNSIYLARVYKNGLGRPNAFLVNRKTQRQNPK